MASLTPAMMGTIGLLAAFLAGLLYAEWKQDHRLIWLTKVPASTCFVLLAILGGTESMYATTILVALGLCWLGDALLIPDRQDAFLAGLVSFLLGHIGFAVAFLVVGVAWAGALGSLVVLVPFAILVGRWLLPNVERALKGPVVVYMVAITAMVALAVGATLATGQWLMATGATLFFLSDLAVARDRFVQKEFINRSWGLPFYYGAQVLLALTVLS